MARVAPDDVGSELSDGFGPTDESSQDHQDDSPSPPESGVEISRLLGLGSVAEVLRDSPFRRFTDQIVGSASLAGLAEQFRDIAGGAVFAQLKVLDGLTPSAFVTSQLTETLRFTEFFAAGSSFRAWRSALVAQNHIGSLISSSWTSGLARQMIQPLLLDISSVSDTAVRLTERVAAIPRRGELTAGAALPLWQREVARLGRDRVSVPALRSAGAGGHGVLGLLATTAIGAPAEKGLSGLLAVVETEVVEPWTLGRIGWQDQMFEAVGRLDPQIPELLRGAWDDVSRRGPAAVSKISNCIVEAVDRSLRAAAPDDEVRIWFSEANLPASCWDAGRRRPTRNLRIRYVLRESHRDNIRLAETHCELVAELARSLVDATQSTKHTGDAAIGRVRSLLVTAEALLSMLFCVDDT